MKQYKKLSDKEKAKIENALKKAYLIYLMECEAAEKKSVDIVPGALDRAWDKYKKCFLLHMSKLKGDLFYRKSFELGIPCPSMGSE